MDTLTEARRFLDMGVGVIPISHREKSPDGRALARSGHSKTTRGKYGEYERGVWTQFQKELPTDQDLVSWFGVRRSGLGVIAGWQNLVIIDFDREPTYKVWEMWERDSGLPPTYKVKSRRGIHVYYFLDESLGRTLKSPLGIDIKGSGYVLAPPSYHPTGFQYAILSSDRIKKVKNLESVIPTRLFKVNMEPVRPPLQAQADPLKYSTSNGPWSLPKSRCNVNESVKILDFFPDAFETGGDFFMAKCPLHDDHDPSFWINAKLNRCGCHSCTSGSMSAIDFYSRLRGLSVPEAISEMKKL